MSGVKLILSDLHLADGHVILDGFGARQQAALQGLASAAEAGGVWGNVDDVELIMNGDCFDFLAIRPYLDDGITTPDIALEKWSKILAAHHAFFDTLRGFLRSPGRHITFIAGNHDAELAFAEVRQAALQAICGGAPSAPSQNVTFCETRFYRPVPDLHIEHGHHYDFWNDAPDVWDEQGNPRAHQPTRLTLPVGTQYFQRAAHPISVAYTYFDRFDPSMDSARQIALLCLLNPAIVMETAQRAMNMLSYQRAALDGLSAGEERIPARLFEIAMLDFAAFQQDMLDHRPEWQAIEDGLRTHPAGQADIQTSAILEFFELRDALSLPPREAVKAILQPRPYFMGESVAMGMHNVLRDNPALRYVIAGHTHMLRRDTLNHGAQVYLNTATWTTREAKPTPDQVTPELLAWLRNPLQEPNPLQDITRMVFALAQTEDGQPSTAELCVWEGGERGHYRVLS